MAGGRGESEEGEGRKGSRGKVASWLKFFFFFWGGVDPLDHDAVGHSQRQN